MKSEYMPEYLSIYTVAKVPSKEVCKDDLDENWNSFKLACPCGCQSLDILAIRETKFGCLTDPFYTHCPECEERKILFDSRQHGYDAQIEFSYPDPVGEEEVWKCPKCHSPGIVAMTYEYSLDPEEEDLSDLNLPECFSWVFINHLCCDDHAIHEVASIETM